eukprot:TRINITY_DN7_c0_g2_i1.p1 TRINITY_DN7_c0_g2~~TRINITY_DN7_c0_g2_i1.p1  ORF type:complete len:235 (-),score=61.85 TRINITY_DN7_c0_g2_i1:1289-1993(-)
MFPKRSNLTKRCAGMSEPIPIGGFSSKATSTFGDIDFHASCPNIVPPRAPIVGSLPAPDLKIPPLELPPSYSGSPEMKKQPSPTGSLGIKKKNIISHSVSFTDHSFLDKLAPPMRTQSSKGPVAHKSLMGPQTSREQRRRTSSISVFETLEKINEENSIKEIETPIQETRKLNFGNLDIEVDTDHDTEGLGDSEDGMIFQQDDESVEASGVTIDFDKLGLDGEDDDMMIFEADM